MNPPSVVATVPALFDTALPIASHPGAQLTGASVLELVSNADTQIAAIRALQRRLSTRVHLTCMDLSAEAEAFGCPIGQPSPDEVPTVLDRCVTSLADARALPRLRAGDGRTGVQIQTVTGLVAAAPGVPVIACATGPFSLAARLLGVSEALILTASPSPLLHAVLERTTDFLVRQLTALRDAGAAGVFLAEPSAGLIAPRALAEYSSRYVREIKAATRHPGFALILHNCAARAAHLDALLEADTDAWHFGAPMHLALALEKLPPPRPVLGNLDPAAVFLNGTAEDVHSRTLALRHQLRGFPNFVPSSGCDLPKNVPLAHLQAFLAAASSPLA